MRILIQKLTKPCSLRGLSVILIAISAFHSAHLEASAQTHSNTSYGERLGTVHFQVSCNKTATTHMNRGLALLHHMTYEGAESEFAAAAKADPDCAMAYWGQAMTYIHPLWSDPPPEEKFKKGDLLLRESKNKKNITERERAYIAAAERYYAQGMNHNETKNLAEFEKGWTQVHQQYKDDHEAACLYALAHIATADPADKTYQKQKRAGEILREILKKEPDHPGAHHYLIHAYDYPDLAEEALSVARHYGKIAPEVPHALHMPAHIFTRRGLWTESIDWNIRSADSALHHPMGDAISLHHLHALDYLVYAYLQTGQDPKAVEILKKVQSFKGPFVSELAVPYTLAAVPARIALERKDWKTAAAIQPQIPESFPWDQFPAMEAISHFTRAVGNARTSNISAVQESIDRLTALHEKTGKTSAYWAKQIEIQKEAATAWMLFAQKKSTEALTGMRKAVELESTTEKHPVTPGEVLPAREMLADLLMEMNKPQEAFAEYKAVLVKSPGRLNSLHGAAHAAELVGNNTEAAKYYGMVIDQTTGGNQQLEQVVKAKAFLARK